MKQGNIAMILQIFSMISPLAALSYFTIGTDYPGSDCPVQKNTVFIGKHPADCTVIPHTGRYANCDSKWFRTKANYHDANGAAKFGVLCQQEGFFYYLNGKAIVCNVGQAANEYRCSPKT